MSPADGAAPRWLSAEERETWLAVAAVALRLPGALDAQLRRDSGLGHFEYGVLATLSESPGQSLRMSQLAALADGSPSRISMVAGRLERQGWLRRSPDPTDGRSTVASLTPEGQRQVVAAAPGHVEQVRRLVIDPLTKAQVGQLRSIGQRILDAISRDA